MKPRVGRGLLPVLALFLTSACDPALTPLAQLENPPAASATLPENVDGLAAGHQLMAAGKYELALRAYTRAISQQGLTVDVLSALGSANLQLGRLQQSRRLLRMAIDRDEKFVPAWNNLGVALINLGEFLEAREAFRVAFALDAGRSEEIRQNLVLAEQHVAGESTISGPKTDFVLVRRGNGRYLLLDTTDQ